MAVFVIKSGSKVCGFSHSAMVFVIFFLAKGGGGGGVMCAYGLSGKIHAGLALLISVFWFNYVLYQNLPMQYTVYSTMANH